MSMYRDHGKYLCWSEEFCMEEEDAKEIDAMSAREAAEEFTEYAEYDAAEFRVASSLQDAIVHVKTKGYSDITSFKVEGEFVPVYTAREEK